ncbi:MAG: serine hydroxymethyltransferase [Thermoplasmata archaeon]|nr:MAG: serine hydroxymethyltransferase [Thermoplasmata archaeon]
MDVCKKELIENDKIIYDLIEAEKKRLNEGLELIASENFVSRAVLDAIGSTLINKYSEGYPGRRYYGGNEVIDEVEQLAIDRAKELFGCDHANVQPYSGSIANLAVYNGVLDMGDKVMGLNLAHGGHLTHGHPINYSGKVYNFAQYGVDKETHLIDYDEVLKIAKKEKPKMILSGATAYPRIIDFKRFHELAEEVGAMCMADVSHIAGLIIAGIHPSPFPHAEIVTSTTHKTLRGPRGAIIMCKSKFAKDIDRAVFPGMQGGPHNHLTAAKAVAFKEAQLPEFKTYAAQIVKNAKALAEELMTQGMELITGGTDNHLMLIDLTNSGITGKDAENVLGKVRITVNKNMIPYDPRTPFNPSGIRIGTPAITTRGMKESEMKAIGVWIADAIKHHDSEHKLESIRSEVCEMCKGFILYD